MKQILFTTSSFGLRECPELIELQKMGFELIFNPHKRKLTQSEVKDLLGSGVVAMLAGVEPLNRNVLGGAKNLKVISRCGAGLDTLDLNAAQEFGIIVRNTPDAPSLPVAELTIAHMLNLLRHISTADRATKEGRWMPLMGSLLSNKRVGLIGCGRIGQQLIRLLGGFDVNVMVCDPYIISSSIPPNVQNVELDSLLQECDIVSLHMPYSPSTHHLIDSRALRMMKNSAYLINVSRGGLVDEDALLRELKGGTLAGAALDVFESEPYVGPLLELNNIVVTNHMGSYAYEARERMEREAVANLLNGLSNAGLIGGRL
jgi:D-3-phosphoglycerate dehydrogenase